MPAPRELDPLSSLAAFFGAEIRRLRESAGWTQEDLGRRLGWSLATIASVETARRSPPEGFPEKADQVFKLPEILTHLAELVRSTPRWFEHYLELEAEATLINVWSVNVVPGLFQTEDYARAVMHAGRPGEPKDAIELDITERIRRQRILDGPAPPSVWAVLHEAAVKQPIGNVETSRTQLGHLLDLARRPNITIQVLAFAAGEHAGVGGPFTVLDFQDQPPVAFAEGHGGSGRLIDQKDELQAVLSAYDRLRAAALSPEASIGMIIGAMSDIWIDRT